MQWTEETVEHLFINCTFAQDCWRLINLSVDPTANPFLNLERLKNQLNQPFFMEVIILLSWAIWMTRNNKIFQASQCLNTGLQEFVSLGNGCSFAACQESLFTKIRRLDKCYSLIFQIIGGVPFGFFPFLLSYLAGSEFAACWS